MLEKRPWYEFSEMLKHALKLKHLCCLIDLAEAAHKSKVPFSVGASKHCS